MRSVSPSSTVVLDFDEGTDVFMSKPSTHGLLVDQTYSSSPTTRKVASDLKGSTPASTSPTGPWGGNDPDGEPRIGTIELAGGFRDGSRLLDMLAGGTANTSLLALACQPAAVGVQPVIRSACSADRVPLAISAPSDAANLMLVVHGADGTLNCSEDTSSIGPSVAFLRTCSGPHSIGVGAYGSDTERATLAIWELALQFR